MECRGHRSIRPRAGRGRRAPRRHVAQRLAQLHHRRIRHAEFSCATRPGRFRARTPKTSPTFISGLIPSPARSNRFRSRRRAATRSATMPRAATHRASLGRQAVERRHFAARCAAVADFKPRAQEGRSGRTSSARPRRSSARQRRSTVRHRRSTPERLTLRSQKSLRARANLTISHRGRCRHVARPRSRRQWRRPLRPVRISPASKSICSRSPARSRRCSARTASSNRSLRSAASWLKSATPSPRRCRAARSNRSRTKSARCRGGSTTQGKTASTVRLSPASSARSMRFAKRCAR